MSEFKLTVRRRHVFQDTLLAFQTGFDLNKHISVTFVGEPAVDVGGPSREFLRLLMHDMCKSCYFERADDSRVPAHDMAAVQNHTYKHMGKLQ